MIGVQGPSTVKLYPNPTHDRFVIDLFSNESKEVLIGLFDRSGRLVRQQKVYALAGRNTIPWDLDNFAPGIYFLSFEGLGLRNIKIVKE